MSTPNYTFLPWVRYGLGNFIVREDNLIDPNTERSKIAVKMQLKDDPDLLEKEVLLGGPGDVVGIQPHAIIKTVPTANTNQFNANALPFVEFYDEDLPWRYTPATPTVANPDRLRPWLMLVVLKEDEFVWLGETKPLPSIKITKPIFDFLPEESWAWAHTQVNAELPEIDTDGNSIPVEQALAEVLDIDKDLAFSRIVCARKLEEEQQYYAFLIPAFEVGRLAGIGEDFTSTPIQQASWNAGDKDVTYPFYHHYAFATGENIDFEKLARKLAPNALTDEDLPKVNITDVFEELGASTSIDIPSYTTADGTDDFTETISAPKIDPNGVSRPVSTHTTVEGTTELPIESALVRAGFEADWFGDKNLTNRAARTALLDQINEADHLKTNGTSSQTEDPIVNIPPLYGRWHATTNKLQPITGKLEDEGWLTQLNLDPSYRIAAGIGAEIVRDKQDVLMQQAWDQIGEIREANRKLRQTELNKELGQTLFNKHLLKRESESVIGMTHLLHSKVLIDPTSNNKTIHQKVTESTLPNAALDPAFNKLTRAGGPIAKRFKKQHGVQEIRSNFTSKLADNTTGSVNEDLKAAPKRVADEAVMLDAQMVSDFKSNVNGNADFSTASKLNASAIEAKVTQQQFEKSQMLAAEVDFSTSELNKSEVQLKTELNPLKALPKQTLSQINIPAEIGEVRVPQQDAPKPIMAHPEFEQAAVNYLVEKHPDFFAPAMGTMKNNTVSLMHINQAFIESYMVGLNHAMANELLWREFPTDQRGNYFKQFWDTSAYLDPFMIPQNPEDITPITSWPKATRLGTHGTTGIEQRDRVILLLKGELFLQYPDLPIFAQKAEWHNGQYRKLADPSIPGNVKFPLLKAPLKENLLGLGFDLTVQEVKGATLPDGNPDPNGDAGWFFIFKEREGEILFGLDEDSGMANILPTDSSADLHWGHVTGTTIDGNTAHIQIGPTVSLADQFVWGKNAAEMACILQQQPVTLGFHASSLIH